MFKALISTLLAFVLVQDSQAVKMQAMCPYCGGWDEAQIAAYNQQQAQLSQVGCECDEQD